MELSIINIQGKDTGKKVKLSKDVFGVEPNDHAIYLDVKQYLANQRQGTHKSKERAEISGSTRKIKKQKGTGTARAGSIKSPVFRGGGRAFGPRPRNYNFKLNKKLKSLARRSALTYKMKGKELSILDTITFDSPGTSEYLKVMKSLALDTKKTLLVLDENNKNVYLSSRNLSNASVTTVDELNTYDILHADNLIIVEGAVSKLEERLN